MGGKPITELAARADNMPFYAYDKRLILERIAYLKKNLPASVELHYAIKANPMPEVVNLVSDVVDGLDVASGGELEIALNTGCSASTISFAGPGKSDAELSQSVRAGIVINIESANELERILTIAERVGEVPLLAVRVNPDFELKSSGMKMAGGAKPFGIDADQVPALLRRIDQAPVKFAGLHIFSGSQSLSAAAICEAQIRSIELAIRLSKEVQQTLSFVNIGGGFGIPYFPGDSPLELADIFGNLAALSDQCDKDLPGTRIVLELGRFIVGEAGVYVCRIVDRKTSRGQLFLIANGGLHHHLAASGNFGQVLRKNYPVVIANRINSRDTETVTIVGPLCTPLDILADKMALPRAGIGDYVAIMQSGAYGYTASPHRFLGHPMPVELLV